MNSDMIVDHPWNSDSRQAPFVVVDLISLPSKVVMEKNPLGAQNMLHEAHLRAKGHGLDGLGCCHVCGTGLQHNVIMRDANGRKFVTGTTCMTKSGDSKLITKAEMIIKQRRRHARREARERRDAERQAAHEAKLEEQRQRNGGMTDAELERHNEKLEREARRAEVSSANRDLIFALAASSKRTGDFCHSMAHELQTTHARDLSPRALGICLDIAGKVEGRKNSKAWKAEVNRLVEILGLDNCWLV